LDRQNRENFEAFLFYHGRQFLFLLKKLLILLLAFAICRILFFLLNLDLFDWVILPEYLMILMCWLRVDQVGIAYVNLIFSLLIFTLLQIIHFPRSKRFIFILFMITSSIAWFFNCIDMAYYRFTLKRSSSDLLQSPFLGDDVNSLVPQLIYEYWCTGIVMAGLIIPAALIYTRTALSRFPSHIGIKFFIIPIVDN